MPWSKEGRGEALRSPIPWIALAAALAIAWSAWLVLERNRESEARLQFERRTETAVAAVRARMLSYEQVLRSGAARMSSSRDVSRDEWRDFINHLQLGERFPGIQSLSYAELSGGDAIMVVFEESFDGRAPALGFDSVADSARRGALDMARKTLEPAISGKVVVTPPRQHGFVMYVPVFRPGLGAAPAQRRAGLVGFVVGPLRMHDLMRGILDDGVLQVLDMRVFDGGDAEAGAELIDTRTAWRVTPALSEPLFTRTVGLPMPGRPWTLQFVSRPEFDAALREDRPWVVAGVGVIGSLVVFLLTLALVAAWHRARHLSLRDPLTGLYNRRYVDETMDRELNRAKRTAESIGLIVLDLDHFKQLNDTHGHDAGDFVLCRLAELMRNATRASDISCRLGGEEFMVILPGATLEVARNRAEAIRAAFASLSLDFDGRPLGPFSLSAGVSALGAADRKWATVVQQADRALYTAKQAGRNRVLAVAPE
jgi:diguanylate cyclase (GGDEF)-like protein